MNNMNHFPAKKFNHPKLWQKRKSTFELHSEDSETITKVFKVKFKFSRHHLQFISTANLVWTLKK